MVWAWATHFCFQRKILQVLCENFDRGECSSKECAAELLHHGYLARVEGELLAFTQQPKYELYFRDCQIAQQASDAVSAHNSGTDKTSVDIFSEKMMDLILRKNQKTLAVKQNVISGAFSGSLTHNNTRDPCRKNPESRQDRIPESTNFRAALTTDHKVLAKLLAKVDRGAPKLLVGAPSGWRG